MTAFIKGGLLAVLILQLVTFAFGRFSEGGEYLEVGQEVPFEIMDLNGRAVESLPNPCQVAFVCSLNCPFCAALADSLGQVDFEAALSPLWILGGEPKEAMEWGESHGIAASDIRMLGPRSNGPLLPATTGRIWFTPMRVILDETTEVRDARPSDVVPTAEETASLCRSGGIAPRSIEELREEILKMQQGGGRISRSPTTQRGGGVSH